MGSELFIYSGKWGIAKGGATDMAPPWWKLMFLRGFFSASATWNSLDSDRGFTSYLFVPGAKVDRSITLQIGAEFIILAGKDCIHNDAY